jgi:probable selenium-dependent hydroxylase accessory protein YqeC
MDDPMAADPRGLAELRSIIESSMPSGGAGIVSLVGGGGKTSTLFALARSFADSGLRVLVTTTTRILYPELGSEREGRGFAPTLLLADPLSRESLDSLRSADRRVIIGSQRDGSKLIGILPEAVGDLAGSFDLVLVEADGSRRLPIKAPAPHEPVVPPSSSVVIGVIGLDALGAPMDEATVYLPELFGPLVGCARGEALAPIHLARLAASPMGLFKGAPADARRVVLLNKADAVPEERVVSCLSALSSAAGVDAAIAGAIGAEGVAT